MAHNISQKSYDMEGDTMTKRVYDHELDFLDDLTCIFQGIPFTGISCEYWPSGRLRSEIFFKDGVQHGKAVEWYESGQKKSESEYRNNDVHGICREWYENSMLKQEDLYEFGIEIYHRTWSEEGTLLESREIKGNSSNFNLLKKWRAFEKGQI